MNFKKNVDLHMKTRQRKRRTNRMEYPFEKAIQWNFCSVDDHKNLINIR